MILQFAAYALVVAGAVAVVLTRVAERQIFVFGLYGFALTLLFVVLQAPDVALSQLTIGTVAMPVVLLMTVLKARPRRKP